MIDFPEIIEAVKSLLGFAVLLVLIAGTAWLIIARNRSIAKANLALVLILFVGAIAIALYASSKQPAAQEANRPIKPDNKVPLPDRKKDTVALVEPVLTVAFSGLIKDVETGLPITPATLRYGGQSFSNHTDGTFSGNFQVRTSSDRVQILCTAPGYQAEEYSFFSNGQHQIILMQPL